MEKKKKDKRMTESHKLLEDAVPNGLKAKPEIFILYFHNGASYDLKEFKTKPELILFIKTHKISENPRAYKGVRIGNLE